jgi:hypothetical protein
VCLILTVIIHSVIGLSMIIIGINALLAVLNWLLSLGLAALITRSLTQLVLLYLLAFAVFPVFLMITIAGGPHYVRAADYWLFGLPSTVYCILMPIAAWKQRTRNSSEQE